MSGRTEDGRRETPLQRADRNWERPARQPDGGHRLGLLCLTLGAVLLLVTDVVLDRG